MKMQSNQSKVASDVLIPFAVSRSNNEIVAVDEVPNGLSCDCICISCKSEMVAKNAGRIVQPHFAHVRAGTAHLVCDITFENSVFWMCEILLASLGTNIQLLTPSLVSEYDGKTLVAKKGLRNIDCASLKFLPKKQTKSRSFIVDVVHDGKNHPLGVTLTFEDSAKFTSPLEWEGVEHSHLLINLSNFYSVLKQEKQKLRDALKKILLEDEYNRLWIYHHRAKKIEQTLSAQHQVNMKAAESPPPALVRNTLFSEEEQRNLNKLVRDLTFQYRK